MPSLETLLRLAVAAILLWAAVSKLSARPAPRWLGALGIPPRARGLTFIAVALVEAALGALLLADVRLALFGAVALGIVFVGALAIARFRGVRRLECGCFGAKERDIHFVFARAVGFTALAALAASEPATPSRDTLIVIALAVLAAAVVVLAGLVLALYRQVGVLTLRVGPGVALELAEEGPPVGSGAPALDELVGRDSELVVFFGADCRLCRSLAPGVRALAREGLQVHIAYEEEAPDVFERWSVPGTPFAVHVFDGIVTAKGTVNTLEQLEGLLATGKERASRVAA